MKHKIKQGLAVLMTAVMIGSNLYSPVSARAYASNAETDMSNQNLVMDNYTLESTNSFGDLLLKELQPEQEKQEENNGYNIFSVDVVETIATVSYESQEDCNIVVGIYDETGVKLLASGNAEVTAEEKVTDVTIEIETMPTYFYLKAYLIETNTFRPLCTVYESPNYTQDMQEFLAKTTDDFDADRVLNLDEDKTNNFAVYLDSVKTLIQSETQNQISNMEGESQITVIEQADEKALSLQPGDVFTYEVNGELYIQQVTDVVKDGTTVTVNGTDAEIEQVFDYMKIDTTANLSDATYDPSTKDPDIQYLGGASTPKTNEADIYNETINDRDVGSESKKDSFPLTGKADISGNINLKLTNGIKLYFADFLTKYVEFTIKIELEASVEVKAQISLTIPLGMYEFAPILGMFVRLTPDFIVEAQAKITISGTMTATVGCRAVKTIFGEKWVENISQKPEFKPDIKVEGKIFIGFSLKPEVRIVSKHVATIEFESKVGVEVKVTLDTEAGSNHMVRHDCNRCYMGEINGKWNIKFKTQLFDQEWLTLEYELLDYKFEIAKFHYSVDHQEFSFSPCSHKNYQVKVIVLEPDGQDKKLVSDATINGVYKTSSNGMVTLWMSKGAHLITVKKDGYKSQTKKIVADEKGTGTYFVLEKNGSVVISEDDDLSGKLALGELHGAAIMEDGSLYTWGYNYHGQLGNGTTTDSNIPIKIMDHVKQVSLGEHYSAAITDDESLYVWGWNNCGQLGNGTTTDSGIPIKIMDHVKQVDLGELESAAITEDGSLYTWGYNYYGQLGNGTTTDSSTPIKIMDHVKQVSLGKLHSAAITEDGSLYTWGNNSYGQLGNGTRTGSNIPIKIMDHVKQVSLGELHSAAITEDGSLYVWGWNSYGLLGNGTTTDSNIPIKIMEHVKQVSLGSYHSAVITEDKSLYTWGLNCFGQLGNGWREYYSSTSIKIMDCVKQVSLGEHYSAAITEDGSLYTWGYNSYGQLGNGTRTDSGTPIKIMNVGTYSTQSGELVTSMTDDLLSETLMITDSAISEGGTVVLEDTSADTTGVSGLQPNTVYNLYNMRSQSVQAPYSAENLLYIGQGTTDTEGDLTLDYEAREVDETAVTFAVAMTTYDIAGAEAEMTDLDYTGEEQLALFDVIYNGHVLSEGIDYRLSGDISATEPGTYTVTVTGIGIYSGKKDVDYHILSPEVKVTDITLNKTSLTLEIGKTTTLTATITPTNATNKGVTWKSSNATVASVSTTGVITAKAAGTATITCTAKDGSGVKATCKVTVKEPAVKVTGLKLNKTNESLNQGESITLKATVTPSNATNKKVTWASSNTKVATVNSSGKVTAKAAGTATITCKVADGSGKKATCKIKVYSNTEAFVARIYVNALNREPEAGGLKYWTDEITSKRRTPVAVAECFFFAPEFTDKKLSNTEYVKVLYRTFMGREYDQAGLNYWVNRLNKGESRKTVLKSFAGCPEFQKIVKNFGL